MGQPAEVNQADRLATRTLAARIVESVWNDEEMPLGLIEYSLSDLGPDPAFARADVEMLACQLAQEVCELVKERDEAVTAARQGDARWRDHERRHAARQCADEGDWSGAMSKEMFNRLSHDWLQEQLRDLADHIVLANRPATMDEMRIRLRDIAVGRPWRDGAFKRAMCKTRTP